MNLLKPLIFLYIILVVFTSLHNLNLPNSNYYDNFIQAVPGPSIPIIDEEDLPTNWSWSNITGTNYLTTIKNQHIPQYCGACWAFAAASALSDRIKIMRKAQWPDILISAQVLLSCANVNKGCNGGSSYYAYSYIYQNYITDESCSIYQARGFNNGLECSSSILCQTCDSNGSCYVPSNYPIYGIKYYGSVSGELDMMNEIYNRGPISCGLAWTPKFQEYKGGIFIDKTNATSLDHYASIVGFGIENNTKYWLVRNSWGSYWGENGFFKIIRGINNMGIETYCSWAVPLDTWTSNLRNYTQPTSKKITIINDIPVTGFLPKTPIIHSTFSTPPTPPTAGIPSTPSNSSIPVTPSTSGTPNTLPTPTPPAPSTTQASAVTSTTSKGGCSRRSNSTQAPIPNKLIGSQPWDYLNLTTLPSTWDWRNISGTNYITSARNQATPTFCGSCWAFTITSLLSDRINILNNAQFPIIILSPQVLLNCNGGGNCNGGNPLEAYTFISQQGLSEDTCENYQANNGFGTCLPIEICKTCWSPSPLKNQTGQNNCRAVMNYTKWNVTQYGEISGVDQMKAEIYARGPIGCGIQSTSNFEAYIGGIYSESINITAINHEVTVVGWDYNEITQTEYWIGKNSWGTFWGNQGFFKIQMYTDNLGIETSCHFGVPARVN